MTRRTATAPRLVPLAVAMRVLDGHHPIKLGIGEALPGSFDLNAIHAALDRKAGLVVELSGSGTADNENAADDEETDELVALEKRIAANAARRP